MRAGPAAWRAAARCVSAARRASDGRRRNRPGPPSPPATRPALRRATPARRSRVLLRRRAARSRELRAGRASPRLAAAVRTVPCRRKPGAHAPLEVDLQRSHLLAQPIGLEIAGCAAGPAQVREPIGERARADRFGDAERFPDGRGIAHGAWRDRLRCEPRTAHSSRTGNARASPGSRTSRGSGFRSRPPCRRRSNAPFTSPASSSASASAELVSMRLKSSCRRA